MDDYDDGIIGAVLGSILGVIIGYLWAREFGYVVYITVPLFTLLGGAFGYFFMSEFTKVK